MTKDADKDEVELEDGSRDERRRRKKSGLRIPSDNVPRTTPVRPSTAPNLDSRAPTEEDSAIPGEHVPPMPEDPDVAVSVAYTFGAGSVGKVPGDDGATDPMRQSAPRLHSRAVTEPPVPPAPDADTNDGAPEIVIEAAPPEGEEEDELETRATREMPAVNLRELGLVQELISDESSGGIEISIEEGEPEEAQDVGADMPRRAHTVALSDDDLEELIETSDESTAAFLRQTRRGTLDSQPARELPETDASPEQGGGVRQVGTLKKSQVRPEPGVPAAVAALEGAGMESPHDTPLVLGGPGDSGEILSEDLIEEVDDSDVEEEPDEAAPTSPPPAPRAPAVKKPPPAPAQSGGGREAAPAPKRRKGKPWYEVIFDEDYLRTLPFLTPQATQAEAAFVGSALEAEPGSQLLDIGCGYGRHAMELAARGYQVIALDLSLPLLLRGADEAQRRALNINFVHGDMRELNFEEQFDGAYCLFSTFGYFDDESNKRTLQGIGRALKPGARLVIEILNRDYLIEDLPARVWWEGDGCVVLEEVDFNYFTSRVVSNRSVVFDDGRQLEQEISLRAYSLHEVGKLLHQTGFRVIEVSGSMAMRGRFFGNKSREIIVIAERRVSERAASQAGSVSRSPTMSDTADSQ